MLSLTHFRNNAGARAGFLETAQRAVQGFIIPYSDF